MRCKSCDVMLTDKETGRKDPLTGDFLDLCELCYSESQQAVIDATEVFCDKVPEVVD
jgi:hypothetical protein